MTLQWSFCPTILLLWSMLSPAGWARSVKADQDQPTTSVRADDGGHCRRVTEEPLPLAPASDEEKRIEAQLAKPATLDFVETPLSDVVDFIRDYAGVNFVLDRSALEEEGLTADKAVTIKVKAIPLKSGLKAVLAPLNLTYIVKDDIVQITSQVIAENELVVWLYPVHDLVADAEEAKSLIKILESFVAPNSWSEVGGAGTVEFFAPRHCLLINQTEVAHKLIVSLFSQLRKAPTGNPVRCNCGQCSCQAQTESVREGSSTGKETRRSDGGHTRRSRSMSGTSGCQVVGDARIVKWQGRKRRLR